MRRCVPILRNNQIRRMVDDYGQGQTRRRRMDTTTDDDEDEKDDNEDDK